MVKSRFWLALFFIFLLFHLTRSEQGKDTKLSQSLGTSDSKKEMTSSKEDDRAEMTDDVAPTSNTNASQLLLEPKSGLQELNKSKHDAEPGVGIDTLQDESKNNILLEGEDAGINAEVKSQLKDDITNNTENSTLSKNETEIQQDKTDKKALMNNEIDQPQDKRGDETQSSIEAKVIDDQRGNETVTKNLLKETQQVKTAGDAQSKGGMDMQQDETGDNTQSKSEPEDSTEKDIQLESNKEDAQNHTDVVTQSKEEKREPKLNIEDNTKPKVVVEKPDEGEMINADEEEETVGNDLVSDDDDDTVDGDDGELNDTSEEHRHIEYDEEYSDDDVEQQIEENVPHQKYESEEMNQRVPNIMRDETFGQIDENKSIYSTGTHSSAGANLFFYFVFSLVVCFVLYILYHNKRKIRSMMGDGRRQTGSRWRGGGGSGTGGKYQKLNTNETYLRSYH